MTRIDSNSEVDGGEDDEASESGSGSGSGSKSEDEEEDEDEILVSTIPDLNRGQSEYQKVSSAKCMLGV